jgi:tRNA pseudouridine55 synthase
VTEFEITEKTDNDVSFRLRCSCGTYVRAIAHDLGQRLGVGGHLVALRRTMIGDLTASDAWTIDEIEAI